MESAYFDTSVFLAIFNGEPRGKEIKELLRELKKDKVKIQTSIITIQEVSVLSYRRGTVAADNHAKVEKLARIQGVSRDVALTAAKLEAHMKDTAANDGEQKDENKRRKWDCFHVASALDLKCITLYTCDPNMLKLRDRLGITVMEFAEPKPRNLVLSLQVRNEAKVIPPSAEF